MASTSAVEVVVDTPDFTISRVTITWDNSDLVCGDIVHQLPKGVDHVVLQGLDTTAGTNIANFTVARDNTNGEINITALQETGGTIANKVTDFYVMSVVKSHQNGDSLDV